MEIDDQNVNGKKGEAWDEARWGRQQHIFVSVITNYYIYDDAHKPETKVEGWIPSHRAVRVPSPHTTSDDAAMLSKNIYICWCFEEKEKKKLFWISFCVVFILPFRAIAFREPKQPRDKKCV